MWCNRFTRVYTQHIMIIWDKWQHHLSHPILSMISQEISPLLLPSPNWTLSSHCCWAEKRQLKRNPIWTNFSGEMLQLFLVVLRHNRTNFCRVASDLSNLVRCRNPALVLIVSRMFCNIFLAHCVSVSIGFSEDCFNLWDRRATQRTISGEGTIYSQEGP